MKIRTWGQAFKVSAIVACIAMAISGIWCAHWLLSLEYHPLPIWQTFFFVGVVGVFAFAAAIGWTTGILIRDESEK